jgi:HEAT repeat protein
MWLLAFAFVVIQHSTAEQARQRAALDLGCIGGDRAVRRLEAALRDAGPDTRGSIATALGNTRSRLAVPVLISMFADDPARDEVCDALVNLTHRTWCDGGDDDDASLRRAWRYRLL